MRGKHGIIGMMTMGKIDGWAQMKINNGVLGTLRLLLTLYFSIRSDGLV